MPYSERPYTLVPVAPLSSRVTACIEGIGAVALELIMSIIVTTLVNFAFANMAPFYKAFASAKFTNVVTIIDVISSRATAPIPSMYAVTRADSGATGTNVYGITESGIKASVNMTATTYDIWTGEKTFNLASDVWDLTGSLPTFKNVALYTMSWYKGDLNGDGKYYAYEQNVSAGNAGDTVTIPATAPVMGNFRVTGDPITELSVTSATLANGTELKVYKKATNEDLQVLDDNGNWTSRNFTVYDAANGKVTNVGTIGGQENAFGVTSKNEWSGRAQLSNGPNHYNTYQGDWIRGMGYKTFSFKIYFTNTSKIYMTQNYDDGTAASVYFNNSAAKVEMYNSAKSWCKVVDANGNEIADGQTITLNAWYTVTMDISKLTGSGRASATSNTVYICTASAIENSYYLADARLSKTAFGA